MEETQAIDFADFPVENDYTQAAGVGTDQVAGELKLTSEPANRILVYLGLNVVGRGSSSQADHDGMLDKWKTTYPGMPVHDLESGGAVCFIKDLGSRNKTMLGRAGGLTVLQANGDRYSVLQGDKLRFGTVDTVIQYSTEHAQATAGSHAQAAAPQDGIQQTTGHQGNLDRSPTPEMANANPPSAPLPNTDNDMTLPWDDPPDHQQDYASMNETDSGRRPGAVNHDTQAFEPMFAETQLQAPSTDLLPETQVNEIPSAMPPASLLGSHQQAAKLGSASRLSQERQTATDNPGFPSLASGLPHVPVAEPTQLVGEPTQLALPLGHSSGPAGTSSSLQTGTALASAAAQAMTGAQPTQASVLPSSAGLPTGMPSLAPEISPSQPAVAGTSATGAGRAQAVAGASLGPGNLPVTRPQADAVLHLPSQPSGSQHAAHPHGPPRHTEAATAEAPSAEAPGHAQPTGRSTQALQPPQGSGGAADGSASQQKHAQQQLPAAEPEVGGHGTHVADEASAEGSDHNTLLDSVLGHDEDDSIWMPPASMPDSEGPSQEAAVLPAAGGQDMPLQSAAAPLPDARQPSDSDETQDSQPTAQEEVQRAGAAEPAAVAGPVRQGRRGRGAAPGDMGMYTGAFAFPDSASLEISQPAVEPPIPRRSNTSAATAAKRGPPAKTASDSETVAKAAAASAKSVVLRQKEATGKKAEPANSGGKAVGRVVPSAWKVRKATPVIDQPVQTTKTGSPPDKIAEASSGVNKTSRQLLKPVVHEPDKQSPWRTRGTPLGGGPGPSQLPDSEDVSAAMAAAGQMAAFFPSTQAEPDTDGKGPVPSPPSAVQADVAVTTHQDSKCNQDIGARLGGERAIGTAAAVDDTAAGREEEEGQPAAAAQPHKVDNADADVPGKRRRAAAAAHTAQKETDKAVIQSSKGQEEHKTKASNSDKLPEGADKAPHAAGRGRKKGISNRSTGFEDEEQGTSKAGRGRGRRSVGPGGRGRKGSKQGGAAKGLQPAAVEDDVVDVDIDTEQSKAAAVKSKRQRGASREGSPGVQATRVSKRQKAKADAQAAEAADLEQAEDVLAADEDPFSGAATQAAAGALEELRRSATPDEDPEDEEAEAAVPMLMPTKKGRRGTHARPAAASTSSGAAAVAAAQALVEGAAGAAPHPAGQSVTGQAKRRASGNSKAAASSAKGKVADRAQSTGGGAEPSTASAQSHAADGSPSATAGDDLQSSQGICSQVKGQGRASQLTAVQGKQGGFGSRAQGRSRLSKASSSQAEPAAVEPDTAQLPVTYKASNRAPAADGIEAVPAVTRKRRSGTTLSGAQADVRQTEASADVQPQPKGSTAEEAAAHTGSEAAAEGAGTAAKGGRAKRKSAPVTATAGAPAASAVPGASGRRGSRGGAASQEADTATAADTPAAAPASRAKRGRASTSALPDAIPVATAAAVEDKEDGDQAGPSSRGEGAGVTDAAAGHGPAKRGSGAKANSRKRSRQDEASLADEGPASHVKAARKASDSKQVRVLYSTTLDKSKKASMSKVVKRLGGCVEDKEGPEFTHFVTLHPTAPGQTDRGFKKSINALIALAAGRPIVSDSWIDACGRSGSFVDPTDHLLIDTAAQKKFGFDMRTSYERAQHQLLLTGLHVFFTPGMLAAESDKGSNIKSLVGHAGGVVEHQLPRSASAGDAEVSAQWLLIANEKSIKAEQKWGSSSKVGPGLSFHGRTVLIDSIMQQSLDRKHGVLFTT